MSLDAPTLGTTASWALEGFAVVLALLFAVASVAANPGALISNSMASNSMELNSRHDKASGRTLVAASLVTTPTEYLPNISIY